MVLSRAHPAGMLESFSKTRELGAGSADDPAKYKANTKVGIVNLIVLKKYRIL